MVKDRTCYHHNYVCKDSINLLFVDHVNVCVQMTPRGYKVRHTTGTSITLPDLRTEFQSRSTLSNFLFVFFIYSIKVDSRYFFFYFILLHHITLFDIDLHLNIDSPSLFLTTSVLYSISHTS